MKGGRIRPPVLRAGDSSSDFPRLDLRVLASLRELTGVVVAQERTHLMKRTKVVAAASIVAAASLLTAASATYADVTYADTSNPFSSPAFGGDPNIGSTSISGNPSTANVGGPPDGVYLRFTGDGFFGGGTGNGSFTMAVDFFNQGNTDIGLIFFTGHASTGVAVTVTQVDFFSSALTNNQATISVSDSLTFITAASQSYVPNLLSTANVAGYSTQSNFSFNDIVRVQFTFSVTGYTSGATFEFDAIANPEPGTIALFGLGAAGLGGFAWRRRKARLAARSKS